MNSKNRILTLALICASTIVFGQTNFGVSGSTAGNSNGSANNVSNDLFTGTANISIPIVDKAVDGLGLDVNISYNTKGIKLDDVSSVVGLGWSLNYGPVISRVVRGIPDEFIYIAGNGAKHNYGYWHRTNNDIPYTTNPNNIPKHLGEVEATTNISVGSADGQMDIFSLSLNGTSVEFMFNANDEIHTIPSDSRIIIQRSNWGSPITVFPKGTAIANFDFIITDEGGNKYHLTPGDLVKANVVNPCPTSLVNVNEYYPITWVIKHIETYNGKQIQYEYKNEITYNLKTSKDEVFSDIEFYPNNCTPNAADFLKEREQLNKTRLIEKIIYPDLEVNFIYNDPQSIARCDVLSSRILQNITIFEKDNAVTWNSQQGVPLNLNLSRTISLNHDYFSVDAVSGTEPLSNACPLESYFKLRLKLNEVRLAVGVTERTLYSFNYFETTTNVVNNPSVEVYYDPLQDYAIPYRLNPCQDYWGYYNANQPVSDFLYIPYVVGVNPPNNSPQGIHREPISVEKARVFSLRTITNESKGCTEFFYGLNEANINGTMKKLDGLRLEEVHNYNLGMLGNTTKHITKYEYDNGEWIAPKVGSYPNIINLFKKTTAVTCGWTMFNGEPVPPTFVPNITSYSNHFLGQMEAIQHGYGKVIVTNKKSFNSNNIALNQSINENKEVGKTENYFTTLKTLPAGILDMHGNCLSGAPFTVNLNNLILNPPVANTNFAGLTLNNTNYFKPYDEFPFTFKQYYIDWALGVPYKVIHYDATGHISSESVSEYDVYVKSLNTDNNLNLNAETSIWNKAEEDVLCNNANYLIHDYYYPYTGRIALKRTISKSYINDNESLQKTVDYEYDNQTNNVKKIIETQPNNTTIERRVFYNSDNNNWNNNSVMSTMNNANIHKMVHGEIWRKESNQNSFKLINASGSGYFVDAMYGKVRPKNQYTLIGKNLVNISPIVSGAYTVADANSGAVIPDFDKSSTVTKYDLAGHPIEISNHGKYASYIYDYYQGAVLAEISNAKNEEVAFNSFESNIYETDLFQLYFNKDMGNWLFHPAGINFTYYMTGRHCFNMGAKYYDINNILQSVEISSSNEVALEVGKKYVLSFWKKENPTITIQNWQMNGNNYVSQPITYNTYQTNVSTLQGIDGWTYCEAVFTASYEKVKLLSTATNCYIDELRLYPADATMTTVSLTPLYGKTSICDEQNQILRYEYDEYNRYNITRDIQGNILSKTKTAVQSND